MYLINNIGRTALVIAVVVLGLGSCQNTEQIKFDQYVSEGYSLYQTNCANCHQKNGEGLLKLYPAITADFVKNPQRLACIIKKGMTGTIVVNREHYNRPMPASATLQDLDIAELITYLSTTHTKATTYTPTDSVTKWLVQCK
jgi:mono/diheme cytochrome c family protein